MWVSQEYDCNKFGVLHSPLHTGIQGAGAPDQRAAAPVGVWRRAESIQVRETGITISTTPLSHPNPHHTTYQNHRPPHENLDDGTYGRH